MSEKSAREARQAKVAAMQAQKRAQERRRRTVVVLIAALVAVVVATVVVLAVKGSQSSDVAQAVPPSASGSGEPFVMGSGGEDAPVIDLYEDFQCPACQQFETALGSTLTQVVESGNARVRYHMLSFLDANLGNDASFRAAQAAAAADEQGKFLEFHALVYANQGAEGSGFTDSQLEQFAKDAGVEDIDAWRTSYKSGKYEEYVRDTQTKGNEANVASTPTILLNGEDVRDQITTPQDLLDLVAAAGGAPAGAAPAVPGEDYDGSVTEETATP